MSTNGNGSPRIMSAVDPVLALVVEDDPTSPSGRALSVGGQVPREDVPDVLRSIADQYEAHLAAERVEGGDTP